MSLSPSKSVKNTWIERMMRKPSRGEIPLPKDIYYTNLGNEFRELGHVGEYELVPGNNELRSASKEWEKERKEFAALDQRFEQLLKNPVPVEVRLANTNPTKGFERNARDLFGSHSRGRGGRLFKSKKIRKSKGKKNKNKKTRRIKK